ncbi:glycosyl transferase family protein [Paraburkholderia acidisoli]|uniref:Glycosyl transferase family protein n=1 Tax=Paraburkholderia acidisoli TaxID=2571748 RepID=A0A7Z2GPX6_9BURK|nr:glycosyl transferase family protein [Paraburkholderia acidisoli]QGZ65775.1 glycosyl transferase family protein [Paraburkholderia acidisoli]
MTLATLGFYGRVMLAEYYQWLEHAAFVVSAAILLSSLDDLFIDLWYWIREAVRFFTVRRQHKPLTVAQLQQRAEQPLAIMVPAWHEHDVIAAMIEDLVRVLDYRSYRVFVGTYQNDAATIAEVERMRHRYKHLHRVEVPHDGPTCKADCLNWIIQSIYRYEFESGTEFAGIIMHDSEDVLHPLELKFFNYLLPRKDMIQLPVASLEREWCELVAGTYMDEFAEWHAKDLVVRESLVGTVPSAGVGTCFSRRAMLALMAETDAQPFNTESLTEDYDVGERIGRMGMQAIFARFPVQFVTRRTTWFGLGKEREVTTTMPLCVREYFPDTLRTAWRQRARWTLGIGLQGWTLTGWSGSLANRYLLLRDRKGIVTSFIGMVGYLLVIQFMLFALASLAGLTPDLFPSPFIDSPWMSAMLTANFCALTLRVVQRVIFTTRLYGWEHGVLAVPRLVISNFINFLAALRAWRLFLIHVVTGKPLSWDKTMHDFPSAGGVRSTRQTLGELLVSWQAIEPETLERALKEEHARHAPLGRVLMANGWLDEETLAEAIAFQSDLPRGELVPEWLDDPANTVPLDVLVRLRTLQQGVDENGHARFIAANLLADTALDQLHAITGRIITLAIVRESEVAAGLRLKRGVDEAQLREALDGDDEEGGGEAVTVRGTPLLGDLLIEMGLVSRERFEAAMKAYRPDRDGRIGDYMVARHVISREALKSAVAAQQRLREAQSGGR